MRSISYPLGTGMNGFFVSLVELKVSSFKENKSGSLLTREPLILIMIDYFQVVNETFEESYL